MSAPRVSVIVLTKNAGGALGTLLDAIWWQRVAGGLEVVAIDSGSTDGTVSRLARRARVIEIAPEDFNHGATRNLGAAEARGTYLVYLVQDAVPTSEDFIERLVTPLDADPAVAGAFARQVPAPGATRIASDYLDAWVAAGREPYVTSLPGGATELEAMPPLGRLRRCAFDNVASCVRRSVWERHPFATTPIAEDVQWSRDVLLAGYSIAFAADAVVRHSHDRGARYEFERTRALHGRLHDLFGIQTIPSFGGLAGAIASTAARHARLEWRQPHRWPRAASLAVAWPLAQYLGAREARR